MSRHNLQFRFHYRPPLLPLLLQPSCIARCTGRDFARFRADRVANFLLHASAYDESPATDDPRRAVKKSSAQRGGLVTLKIASPRVGRPLDS